MTKAANHEQRDQGEWPTEHLPSSWTWTSFADVFTNATTSDRKLAQRDYSAHGKLAVVDQGQLTIAGYTSNESLRHPAALPVLVFGDHTRCVKYVDFQFVQGADGVKVLQPTEALDPRFAFHSLRAVRLPDKGYSRHFKFLAATRFPVAPINEQRRIVAKLEALQSRSRRAREALDAVPPLLDRLRQSILAAAFRGDLTKDWRAKNPNVEPASELLERIRAERRKKWEEAELAKLKAKGKAPTDDRWKAKYKEPEPVDATRLPELPEGWCWGSPREVVAWASGDFLPRSEQREGPYPVYGGNGVSGFHSDFLVESQTIVVGRVGADCGNIHITDGPAWVTDNAIYAGVVPPSLNLGYWHLALTRTDLRSHARGGGQPFVSQETLNRMVVPVPPQAEQEELVARVHAAERRLKGLDESAQTLRRQLQILDRATLAKAFRGELVAQDPADEPANVMLARLRGSDAAPGDEPVKQKMPRRANAERPRRA